MKKRAFTIVEISILAVILLIVACLVIPFSIDDVVDAYCIVQQTSESGMRGEGYIEQMIDVTADKFIASVRNEKSIEL